MAAYAEQFGITKLRGLFTAGSSGAMSLQNGYVGIAGKYAAEDALIIQEATRPLVPSETISKLLLAYRDGESAVACHKMDDYVQFDVSGDYPEHLERNHIIAMQSPEVHSFARMREVFETAQSLDHPLSESCCTMLMYNLGFPLNFIDVGVNNIKIEREEDLLKFSALCKFISL